MASVVFIATGTGYLFAMKVVGDMSVILNALRAQKEEGGAEPSNAFQVDDSGSSSGGGDPGAKKRQIILLIVLGAAIVLLIMLRVLRREEVPPPPVPRGPTTASAPVAPTSAVPAASAVAPVTTAVDNDLQVARSQYKSGQYDDSLKSFQKALDKDPNNASIHNDMGLALLKKELFASAEGRFAKALELDDQCAECYNNLGYLKTALEQPIEAEKYLQKSIALRPDYPDPYFNLGVMYEKNGDIGKAVSSYQSFLKKIPKADNDLAVKIKARIRDLNGE